MTLILHITPRSHWQKAQQMGIYRADSLKTEGFIHCSTPARIPLKLYRLSALIASETKKPDSFQKPGF